METELTIAIATCGRPRILNRCLNSIKTFTDMSYDVIILDNVGAFTDEKNAKPRGISLKSKIINIDDKKIGCTESNNILADACKTKYIMHMDDDVYITPDNANIIDEMFKWKKNTDDNIIIGGAWYDMFYRNMRHVIMEYIKIDNTIKPNPLPYRKFEGLIKTEECLHSMIMNKEAVYSQVRWDEHFKWKGDRIDFFLQCEEKGIDSYTYCNKYFIHDPQPFKYGTLSYEDYGGKEAMKYFEKKWGLKPLVGWDQHQYKPGNL